MEITEYTDYRRIAKRYLGGMDVTIKVNVLGIVNIDQTFSFNAWGERRDATVWSNPTVSVLLLRETTLRGFTGHEHVVSTTLNSVASSRPIPSSKRQKTPKTIIATPMCSITP